MFDKNFSGEGRQNRRPDPLFEQMMHDQLRALDTASRILDAGVRQSDPSIVSEPLHPEPATHPAGTTALEAVVAARPQSPEQPQLTSGSQAVQAIYPTPTHQPVQQAAPVLHQTRLQENSITEADIAAFADYMMADTSTVPQEALSQEVAQKRVSDAYGEAA
ncbi:MAG TPA: hypothetical protein VK983_00135 [Candidatus Limnocylindrales bacterium]|nr:hypothetical protein [Candidatus Limnocylindrales bacterium]